MVTRVPRLFVSAAHKSSGKTTVSVGVAAALRASGLVVQPFKKGPDYIDPMWLTAAAGRSCRNLDFHTMGSAEIRHEFLWGSDGADLALVEGNKGLHDGVSVDGADSNAALAKLLAAPVVLVVDTRGITRGIAPLLRGYRDFDAGVRIAGVILNQVGGERHEGKLVHAVQTYTDIPVLGAIRRVPDLELGAAHLGLVPPVEVAEAEARVARAARRIEADVDLDRVRSLAAGAGVLDGAPVSRSAASSALDAAPVSRSAASSAPDAAPVSPSVASPAPDAAPVSRSTASSASDAEPVSGSGALPAPDAGPATRCPASHTPDVRIAIARDVAFCFYYPGDLEALEAAGARLLPFDTLKDAAPPEADGIFIGGGFPERAMEGLEANAPMRASLGARIAAGTPVYAECGGLMYLARRIRWDRRDCEMVGAIPADVVMHRRPRGRGYVVLEPTGEAPWAPLARGPLHAHEFHHSSLENLSGPDLRYAWRVRRGHGIDGERDGIVIGNLLASYAHLRDVAGCRWAERFVAFVRARKDARGR